MSEARRVVLILGGARSGKSAFAQRLAMRLGEPVLFVATAVAHDEEMAARIAAHQAERPPSWRTLEARRWVGRAVQAEAQPARTILVDCLTLLISNCLLDAAQHLSGGSQGDGSETSVGPDVESEVRELLRVAGDAGSHLIVVSGEVGLGIVPPTPLGRVFRDLLGRANQIVAAECDAVYLMVAGIPVDLRRIAVDENQLFTSDSALFQ